jgi:hypothetical protein
MSNRIQRHAQITFAAGLLAVGLAGAPIAVHALDHFDQVAPGVFAEGVRNAKREFSEKRYDQAAPLLKQAACAGDKESQWALGQMYLLGQGVKRDDATGYSWLAVAAELRPSPFGTAFDKIDASIDASQHAALKARADALIAQYGITATRMSCHQSATRGGHILDSVTCEPQRVGASVDVHQCVDVAHAPPAAHD